MEMRELDNVRDVDIIVDALDMVFDRSSKEIMNSSKQRKLVAETLMEFSERKMPSLTTSRRIHLHFMQAPARLEEVTHVEGLTVDGTRHLVNGTVESRGELRHYPVGQVYRAVGYASSPIPGVPFDSQRRTVKGQSIQLMANIAQTDASPSNHVAPPNGDPLERVLSTTSAERIGWEGWLRVDQYEKDTGADIGRDKINVYHREELAALALGKAVAV